MRINSTLIISFRALRRNILRSSLTALGIIIGVGAVIAMVSIGNGAKAQVEAQIASLGQNIVMVWPGSATAGGMRGGWGSASTLTEGDAQAIQNEVSGIVAVSPEMRDRSQVLANGLNWNTQILGESPEYLGIRLWTLRDGDMFTAQDVRSYAKVAIIGKTVSDQLFPDGDPIGQTIRIRNIPFRILGVLAPKGFNTFGQDQDDVVIIPYSSHLKRVARRQNINSILIQAISPDDMARIQQQVTDVLQQRRQGRDPDFTVRNQLEIAEAATATTKTMTLLLGAIAGVSLIVGGIGIMNIMLVSVTERTREIGIRLAVGAHGREIMLQFLTESVVLSAFGGTLGILLGI
ncbi:MAG: ABC transporter permease, partial [Opitutaceae bacterium]|nr:ABC transporter permease [Opitutaceae bacterium]